MTYYDKDPDEGGKEISGFNLFTQMGFELDPIHDIKKLIEYRNNLFEKGLQNIKRQRQLDGVETDDDDAYGFRFMWLKNELYNIDSLRNGKKGKAPYFKILSINNSNLLELAKYQKYITDEMKDIEQMLNPNTKQQKQKTSYVWQNNPDKELPELYNLMIDKYKLIAPETTYEQFEAVFTGQAIESISPIKWHQDNASELLYFNEAIKDKVNDVWHIYQRLAACFVKPDGKQFNAVWKSLKTNIEINLSPEKQEAIDELVNNF
jgi:hypothetical protein